MNRTEYIIIDKDWNRRVFPTPDGEVALGPTIVIINSNDNITYNTGSSNNNNDSNGSSSSLAILMIMIIIIMMMIIIMMVIVILIIAGPSPMAHGNNWRLQVPLRRSVLHARWEPYGAGLHTDDTSTNANTTNDKKK